MIFNDDHRNFAPIDPSEVDGRVKESDWGGVAIAVICTLAALYFGGHIVYWLVQGCPTTINSAGDIAYQCSDVR